MTNYKLPILASVIALMFPFLSYAQDIIDGQAATSVIGQTIDGLCDSPTFTQDTSGTSLCNLDIRNTGIAKVLVDFEGHRLFVADTDNSRVLVYLLSTDNALLDLEADYFLGGTTASNEAKMASPAGLALDAQRQLLFVSDAGYRRILIFNVSVITDQENAVNVLGKEDFDPSGSCSGTLKCSSTFLGALTYDRVNQRLFVGDWSSVWVYDLTSISNGESAVKYLGVGSSSETTATPNRIVSPYDVVYDMERNKLFVSDAYLNRIMVFDLESIDNGENAEFIFSSTGATGLEYDHSRKRLFVSRGGPYSGADYITVYDVATLSNNPNRINVLGKPNFEFWSYSTITEKNLKDPQGMSYDPLEHTLWVSDTYRNRVLGYKLVRFTATPSLTPTPQAPEATSVPTSIPNTPTVVSATPTSLPNTTLPPTNANTPISTAVPTPGTVELPEKEDFKAATKALSGFQSGKTSIEDTRAAVQSLIDGLTMAGKESDFSAEEKKLFKSTQKTLKNILKLAAKVSEASPAKKKAMMATLKKLNASASTELKKTQNVFN